MQHIPPFTALIWTQFDAVLNIGAEMNTPANSAVPPERRAAYRKAWEPGAKGVTAGGGKGRQGPLA